MPKLTAPNGATVSVGDDKVDALVRRGFSQAEKPKAPAKKAASSKSEK